MATTAKQRFDETINRCLELITLYRENVQNPDFLRAAVVIAVSGLDMYAVDRFMDEFVGYVKTHSIDETMVKLLEKRGLTLGVALDIIKCGSARPMRMLRTVIEKGYSKASMQSFDNIDELYSYFKLGKLTENAEKKAGRKSLRDSIEKLIKRRHEIVHAADYNGKNCLQEVKCERVFKRINDLKTFVESMDAIISNKFTKKGKRRV